MSYRQGRRTPPGYSCKLALVLWRGDVGGAEVLSVALAQRLRMTGVDATVVFVTQAAPLAHRLGALELPYRSLGFVRGRTVALHPRRYAAEVTSVGRDGALLVSRGILGAALRWGGYKAPIVAIEHGDMIELRNLRWRRRFVQRLAGLTGSWASDAEVGVSQFALQEMERRFHARDIRVIPNGIDPALYRSAPPPRANPEKEVVIAFAGRLVAGKGADCLIQAAPRLRTRERTKVVIAGEGPERPRLERLAQTCGVQDIVHFVGRVDNMPAFWAAADIVAVPPDAIAESFSMVALEAMACGKPVVATRSGAIPELVRDGVTGIIVAPGDVEALSQALATYVQRPELRVAHGGAGRQRAHDRYHIKKCADAYLQLFVELASANRARGENAPRFY